MSFDASTTRIQGSMPDGTIAICQLAEIDVKPSKIKEDGSGGNPMAVLTWTVLEGPYAGRSVGFDYVMTGGKTAKGEPMPLRQLFELVDALKVPWAKDPGHDLVARPFLRKKDGQGNTLYCDPDTGEALVNIDFAFPEDFLGKTCRIKFGVRKSGDREFNEVREKIAL